MKRPESFPPDRHAQEPGANAHDPALEESTASSKDTDATTGLGGMWTSWRATVSRRMSPFISRVMSRLPWLRSPRRRALVAGIALVGVVALLFARQAPTERMSQQIAPDTKLFPINGQPTLNFEHFIGNVHITPGPDGQVRIKETRNGETDAITINYAQHGNAITVTVDIPGGLFVDTWVDFEVSVPKEAGFTAMLATGTLEATNLSGRIALSNTNGSIWATGVAGTLVARTQGGSINLTGVSGQVSAITQNGTITTTSTHLDGRSTILAESGTINFHGSLSRTGSYLFRNSNGAVGLSLPSSSVFVLKAQTTSGSINSDFPGVGIYHENNRTEARGTLGTVPRAQLTIQTVGGSIALFRGG